MLCMETYVPVLLGVSCTEWLLRLYVPLHNGPASPELFTLQLLELILWSCPSHTSQTVATIPFIITESGV